MQPKPPQLEKIAAALDVSYNAMNGSDTDGRTYGYLQFLHSLDHGKRG